MAAVASMYAHPSPAAHQYSKGRGLRMCDACGCVEQPGVQRFRTCGGCMITQYCTQECQKRHWPEHKKLCKHTSSTISAAKTDASLPEADLTRHLRKFCSAHERLISWAGFQALQLTRVPANIRQYALHIELTYRAHNDSARRFTVSSARLVPRNYVESRDPLVAQDIQRREERCRKSGGIGTAVILVQSAGMSQVMPIEVDSPSRIGWDARADWADILERYVEAGRTDFQPISTTSRGVIYG